MFEKVKEIICQYVEVEPDDIKPESTFKDDLKFNSYDIMCMFGDAEAEFDIEINQEEALQLTTVGELMDYFSKIITE